MEADGGGKKTARALGSGFLCKSAADIVGDDRVEGRRDAGSSGKAGGARAPFEIDSADTVGTVGCLIRS